MKKTKTTPWLDIKAEYLKGVTPKELGLKYGLKAKQISDKANEEKWVALKSEISENVREDVQERIKSLTDKSLKALEKIITSSKSKDTDIVAASKAILGISGLNIQKQEITQKEIKIEVANEEDKGLIEEL